MCIRSFVSLVWNLSWNFSWNFSWFRWVSTWCDAKGGTEKAENHQLWLRSIISWNITSIHILLPAGYAQMHSLLFQARQMKFPAFLKLWASTETKSKPTQWSNLCFDHWEKCLGRRDKFKPDARAWMESYGIWWFFFGDICVLAIKKCYSTSFSTDFKIKTMGKAQYFTPCRHWIES